MEMWLSSYSTVSFVQPQMAGEADRLVADALHQVAVARRSPRCGDRPATCRSARPACARPAPCRRRWRGPGRAGRWWSRSPGCSPYSGWPAAGECSWRKLLQLLDAHAGVAGQVQQRVEQHRAVAGRQHEAVAVGPARVGGVEFQEAGPQRGGDVGHAHRHAGMAGVGGFDASMASARMASAIRRSGVMGRARMAAWRARAGFPAEVSTAGPAMGCPRVRRRS